MDAKMDKKFIDDLAAGLDPETAVVSWTVRQAKLRVMEAIATLTEVLGTLIALEGHHKSRDESATIDQRVVRDQQAGTGEDDQLPRE